MRISDKALVLQSIKHGDRKLILKIFSRQHGLLTAGLSYGRSGKSKIPASTVMPLNFIEVELLFKENREIHSLTEANCYHVHTHLHGNFSKLGIAQFMHEVLVKSLKEQHGNPELFDFVEGCFGFLNESESDFANLHLYFLLQLSKYLGFEPQNNYNDSSRYFDFREGMFSPAALVWPLGAGEQESQLLHSALKTELLKVRLSKNQKHQLLDCLLNYYGFHVPGFGNLKSLEVLKEVFNV